MIFTQKVQHSNLLIQKGKLHRYKKKHVLLLNFRKLEEKFVIIVIVKILPKRCYRNHIKVLCLIYFDVIVVQEESGLNYKHTGENLFRKNC